ncbi:MAG: hypothetical protein GC136_02705 [Alphaproteobacteria bacterium]|nr:hypothetical protein [Alphaproteobacteria bacterium]
MKLSRSAAAAAIIAPALAAAPFVQSAFGQQAEVSAITGVDFTDPEADLPNPYRTNLGDVEGTEIAVEGDYDMHCEADMSRVDNLPPQALNNRDDFEEVHRREREELELDAIENAAEDCLEAGLRRRAGGAFGQGEGGQDGRRVGGREGLGFSASPDRVRARVRQDFGHVGDTTITGVVSGDTDGEVYAGIRVSRTRQPD